MFNPQRIQQTIQATMPLAQVQVVDLVGDNNHFEVTVVAQEFEGKSMVAQHQMINEIFRPYLNSGELHAMSLKTYTPQKWERLRHSRLDPESR